MQTQNSKTSLPLSQFWYVLSFISFVLIFEHSLEQQTIAQVFLLYGLNNVSFVFEKFHGHTTRWKKSLDSVLHAF